MSESTLWKPKRETSERYEDLKERVFSEVIDKIESFKMSVRLELEALDILEPRKQQLKSIHDSLTSILQDQSSYGRLDPMKNAYLTAIKGLDRLVSDSSDDETNLQFFAQLKKDAELILERTEDNALDMELSIYELSSHLHAYLQQAELQYSGTREKVLQQINTGALKSEMRKNKCISQLILDISTLANEYLEFLDKNEAQILEIQNKIDSHIDPDQTLTDAETLEIKEQVQQEIQKECMEAMHRFRNVGLGENIEERRTRIENARQVCDQIRSQENLKIRLKIAKKIQEKGEGQETFADLQKKKDEVSQLKSNNLEVLVELGVLKVLSEASKKTESVTSSLTFADDDSESFIAFIKSFNYQSILENLIAPFPNDHSLVENDKQVLLDYFNAKTD